MKSGDDLTGNPEEMGLQILAEADSQGLEKELIRQLNKDMSMSGLELSIAEGLPPEKVVQRLKQILEGLVRDDFQGFLNLLYRADVSQSKMSRSEEGSFSDYIDKSTWELLKREWQKVWIRNKIR
ncbi:MAG: hypothetical protein WBV45_13925 [Lutimonas sp.]